MQFTALLPVASCRPIAAYFRSRPRLQLAPYWPAVHGPLEGMTRTNQRAARMTRTIEKCTES